MEPRDRSTWDEAYLIDALYWSERSHDVHTQCGCVLVAPDNTPLSHGYNGHIRGVPEGILPLTRPEKYPWMIHSEHNAILNCARQGKSTLGSTAYVTGEPCINCYQYMYQCGVVRIVYSNFNAPKMLDNEEYDDNVALFKEAIGRKIVIDFIHARGS